MFADVIIDHLAGIIGTRRFRFTCERDLQDGIGALLTDEGLEHDREVLLTPQDRPDFMLSRVAIEVKVDGSLSALTRQIHRYVQSDAVDGVLVVTSIARHTNMPTTIHGKPVRVIHLLGSVL